LRLRRREAIEMLEYASEMHDLTLTAAACRDLVVLLMAQPDLDAIRREAFMAGLYAIFADGQWHFRECPRLAATVDDAYTAWQAQRRGETP
jgi:hypothetical protein